MAAREVREQEIQLYLLQARSTQIETSNEVYKAATAVSENAITNCAGQSG